MKCCKFKIWNLHLFELKLNLLYDGKMHTFTFVGPCNQPVRWYELAWAAEWENAF